MSESSETKKPAHISFRSVFEVDGSRLAIGTFNRPLLDEEARRLSFQQIPRDDVEREVKSFRSKFPSLVAYRKFLDDNELTETGLAESLKDDLRRTDPAQADEVGELVRAAIAELSERDREVLTLAYWEGFSAAEIGAVTGRPAATVRVRLHRARRRLERRLTERRARPPQAEVMRVV